MANSKRYMCDGIELMLDKDLVDDYLRNNYFRVTVLREGPLTTPLAKRASDRIRGVTVLLSDQPRNPVLEFRANRLRSLEDIEDLIGEFTYQVSKIAEREKVQTG